MSELIERLEKELCLNDENLNKLQEFLKTDACLDLCHSDPFQVGLLVAQEKYMSKYVSILRTRLNNLPNPK